MACGYTELDLSAVGSRPLSWRLTANPRIGKSKDSFFQMFFLSDFSCEMEIS